MYKFERYRQLGLADFNQPAGLKMNPENRWVRKAETIPWDVIEEKYTGDDYANINNSLRGVETLTSENRATVKAMKSALDNSALPQDMALYRGTSAEALGSLQNLSLDELVGKTFTEQGFMSTSTSNVVAEGFSGNMQMTIEASKGAQALDISSISQYTTEAEVLFNTGQEMLITSAELKNGILHITVIIE